ncbi:unnamed protein product [Protopolystoma xenopodis]|uniref:Uncharacterized protein n=1 Tax=Protopolystoma xenopodis TaxID=117903 RepID=A0A3S5BMH3_9PLAT|nr:unnamed protein product [Protopolystoma xenopodis]
MSLSCTNNEVAEQANEMRHVQMRLEKATDLIQTLCDRLSDLSEEVG